MSLLESSIVGHRIRIISKAQIRYEGTLYTLRKDENNDLVLVLSKVTSYGTEDRPCEHPVKPINEVYEHIAFRGRELVDLQLLPTPRVGDDPSIISAELESPAPVPVTQVGGDMLTISGLFPQSDNSSFTEFSNLLSSNAQPNIQSGFLSSWSNMSELTSGDNEGTSTSNPPKSETFTTKVEEAESQEVFKSPSSPVQENEERKDSQNRSRGGSRGFRSNSSYQRINRGGFTDDRSNRGSNQPRRYNHRRNYDHGNRMRHDDVNYKEDYDFEKPNAELAEFLEKIDLNANSNVASEHGDDSHQDEETYDSSKSFFDTLSSELMDRANGVVKSRSHREDRKQNFDTFGPAANRIGSSYRGNYRGRRTGGASGNYRGNQRGAYNRYNSNNRQYSNFQNRRDGGENSSSNTHPQPQQSQ